MSDDSYIEKSAAFSFGKRFSTARGALNLSREEVAKELRLGVDIISALEDEDYERLAVPIYVTGYIRNYARLLKIPVEPLLAAYNQVQVESPTIVASAIRKPGPSYNRLLIKIASVLIVLVLIAGIISWFQSQNYEPSTWFSASQEPESSASSIALPELLEPDILVPNDVVVEDATPVVADAEPELEPEKVIEVVQTPPTPELAPVNKHEIILNLTSDSWVDVQDSTGKRLIYDLLRAGKERRVSGLPPFKVFLGNAKGLRIKYNGQLIDIEQHIRGNLARFQIGVAGE